MNTIQVRERGQITLPKELRDAYRLDTGSRLLVVPLDDERFEVRVMPARRTMRELLALYGEEGDAPDIAAEREALGDALDEAIRTGGRCP